MNIFTKQTKKKISKAWKVLTENLSLSFNTGASILGFVMGQFVWIWILNGFLGWFLLWFLEVTNYALTLEIWQLKKIFWILYGLWFFISIIVRLRVEHYAEFSKSKHKEKKK